MVVADGHITLRGDVMAEGDVTEVHDEVVELVLGVLDLACDLGALGDQTCQNLWNSHLSSLRAGTADTDCRLLTVQAHPPLRLNMANGRFLHSAGHFQIKRSTFPSSVERFLLPSFSTGVRAGSGAQKDVPQHTLHHVPAPAEWLKQF
jgi:hypothetical protein